MNPLERALAILLLLTRKRLLPASELAERFEVSVRTIYRDIDRLIALGIPIEAERGAEGGFRLSGDYLSPPIALNRVETTALLVALTLVRGLRDDAAESRPRNGRGKAPCGASEGGPRNAGARARASSASSSARMTYFTAAGRPSGRTIIRRRSTGFWRGFWRSAGSR